MWMWMYNSAAGRIRGLSCELCDFGHNFWGTLIVYSRAYSGAYSGGGQRGHVPPQIFVGNPLPPLQKFEKEVGKEGKRRGKKGEKRGKLTKMLC